MRRLAILVIGLPLCLEFLSEFLQSGDGVSAANLAEGVDFGWESLAIGILGDVGGRQFLLVQTQKEVRDAAGTTSTLTVVTTHQDQVHVVAQTIDVIRLHFDPLKKENGERQTNE